MLLPVIAVLIVGCGGGDDHGHGHQTYGLAPRAWLLERRLQQVAVALRESDAGLDEIARSFGYADQNLMGRQFKKAYGQSPGRFRR